MDKLTEFKDWWVQERRIKVPFEVPMSRDDSFYTAVLYRAAPWQVQLVIFAPNIVVPDHQHPNVDSFEMYLSGDIEFTLEGKVVVPLEEGGLADFDGFHAQTGQSVRVLPGAWHGGRSGPKGGVFLSIQQWLNGVSPTDVAADWAHKDGEERKSYSGR